MGLGKTRAATIISSAANPIYALTIQARCLGPREVSFHILGIVLSMASQRRGDAADHLQHISIPLSTAARAVQCPLIFLVGYRRPGAIVTVEMTSSPLLCQPNPRARRGADDAIY